MKNSAPFITLALLALAFAGCAKKESVVDLGVIELVQNVPKHIKIGEVDWTITEKRFASGKQTITAESAWRQVTPKDLADSSVPPNTKLGATTKGTIDLSTIPTGVEVTGYFGDTLARYRLKHDAN